MSKGIYPQKPMKQPLEAALSFNWNKPEELHGSS